MRINPIIYGLLVVIVFLGVIPGFSDGGNLVDFRKGRFKWPGDPAICLRCCHNKRLDDFQPDFDDI